jgi:hypothetical protein
MIVVSLDQPWAQFPFIRQPCTCPERERFIHSVECRYERKLTDFITVADLPHQPARQCPNTGRWNDCHGRGEFWYDEDTPMAGQITAQWMPCRAGCPKPEARPVLDLTGQRIAIASTDDEPTPGAVIAGGQISHHRLTYHDRVDEGWHWKAWGDDRLIPLPLSHIVGSAAVAACYPIAHRLRPTALYGFDAGRQGRWIDVAPVSGVLELVDRTKGHILHLDSPHNGATLVTYSTRTPPLFQDISDQLPYGDWSPGRYALELVDAAPTTERCPQCWGNKWMLCGERLCEHCPPCPACQGRGRCDPIPAPGHTGWWEREET